MSKILITGSSGFIGSHLVEHCLKQGHQVVGVDSNITHTYSEMQFTQMNCNVAVQPNTLEHIFKKFEPEIVFHLAAYASESRSNHIRSFIHSNNTVGTANVINACINHGAKLIFTSSVAIMSGKGPYHEGMTPNPLDSYGLSKWMSELEIRIASDTQNLKYCIIRPRNVMGPQQNIYDPSRNLWGIWMYNALFDRPCFIYGDGSNSRDFTYIDDLIPALYKAKDLHGYTINVGAEKGYTLNEAADIFKRVTGYNNFQYIEARHEVNVAHCNVDLAKSVLDYKDTVPLEEGVIRMWDWARNQPYRRLDQPPPLEVTVNAHSSLKS